MSYLGKLCNFTGVLYFLKLSDNYETITSLLLKILHLL